MSESSQEALTAIKRDVRILAAVLAADVLVSCWLAFSLVPAVVAAVVVFAVAANASGVLALSPLPAYWVLSQRNTALLWIALPASPFVVPRLRARLRSLEEHALTDPDLANSFTALGLLQRRRLAEAWATLVSARELAALFLICSVLLGIVLPGMGSPGGVVLAAIGVMFLDGALVTPLSWLALRMIADPTPGRLRGLRVVAVVLLLVPPLGTLTGAAVLWGARGQE